MTAAGQNVELLPRSSIFLILRPYQQRALARQDYRREFRRKSVSKVKSAMNPDAEKITQASDGELIRRVADRDDAAFEALVDRYQTLVMSTCFHFLGNTEDSEDVAQDVFVQVYRNAARFRGDSKLSTWLYRIAVNRSLNFIRDNRKVGFLASITSIFDGNPDEVPEPAAPDSERPDSQLEDRELYETTQRAIDSLPKNQRAAWVLHKYEGLSHKEVGDVLGRSVSSVESLIHRAKISLQKNLIGYLEGK
jgi:RNA polymerase sigma-70 factor (ECF subfamily)